MTGSGIKALTESRLFEEDWYRRTYGDCQIMNLAPAIHYRRYADLLGRHPGPGFDRQAYSAQYGAMIDAGMDPLDHFLSHGEAAGLTPIPLAMRSTAGNTLPFTSVADLERKLWGGFSNLTAPRIRSMIDRRARPKGELARLSMALARWHAVQGSWSIALSLVKGIRKFDVKMFRSKKVKTLRLECLIRLGEWDAAEEIIDFEVEKGADGDFALAQCNLLRARDGARAAALQIATLNRVFAAEGLLPVSLSDPGRGFVFGNLACEVPASAYVRDDTRVSILVPVYDAGPFIDVAMEALLAQTWRNLEIIAIDDRSEDDSWMRLQDWAKRDARVKVARNDRNMGAYPTRNRALELATGDLVTVHDSDDWSHPQMIQRQVTALRENARLKLTSSRMARVHLDLRAILRPQRANLEFVHRSYPSILLARADIARLGKWDSVAANADDDFLQRAREIWGADAVAEVLPNVPMSLFLVHEKSLTQQEGTSLNSLTFGIRHEYARQAAYWRKTRDERKAPAPERISPKSPFPIPRGLAPKHWPTDTRYDVVLITDMSLLGGTRRCNEGYVRALVDMGCRVGLFHWPRYDLRLQGIADAYTELSYGDAIDILVPEDEVTCRRILVHHPPILKHRIDRVPHIRTDGVGILVNQSPMQLTSQEATYYTPGDVEATCVELFGHAPTWIPISEKSRNVLTREGGYRLASQNWSPPLAAPLSDDLPPLPEGLGTGRRIVLGRHARDHWTKWPEGRAAVAAAYCADSDGIDVRFLGGAKTLVDKLGALPSNSTVFDFDEVAVSDFIRDLDIFIHYVHPTYIEEFGRNVAEAMAAGRVVVLPESFRESFGAAALYCAPDEVETTARAIFDDPDAYRAQAERGFDFVRSHCDQSVVRQRLSTFLGRS